MSLDNVVEDIRDEARARAEEIREQAEAGRTVLFSTHVMEHAERLCDRIVLMARGEKVFDGRVDEALSVVPRQVDLGVSTQADLTGTLSPFGDVSRLGEDASGFEAWRVMLRPGVTAQALLKACVEAGVELAFFEPLRPHLHDAFVRLVADPEHAEPEEA